MLFMEINIKIVHIVVLDMILQIKERFRKLKKKLHFVSDLFD